MASTKCPNGHGIWNGDGRADLWIFRVGFFREFVKMHPNWKLRSSVCHEIYDCMDILGDEELDCWYCDECKGIVVFVGNSRYDFKPMDKMPEVELLQVTEWEEYIVLRDWEFDEFKDYYEGMNPLEAIESYKFEYKYRVSPDSKFVYAFDSMGRIVFGYYQSDNTNI